MREKAAGNSAPLRFMFFSLFGLYMFFFPLEWMTCGNSGVPVDFIVHLLQTHCMPGVRIFILALMYAGALMPFTQKTWNNSVRNIFLSFAKIAGAVFGTILYFGLWKSNAWLWRSDIGPFLFNGLAVHTGLYIPIVSVFLAFLSGYGLIEFVSVLTDRIMRTVFDIRGSAAVNMIASLYGSYPSAFVITNEGYRSGRYTTREAAIIATGFSTVSVASIFAIAKALGLIDGRTHYLLVATVVTLITTAFTARLWPLYYMPDRYFEGRLIPKFKFSGNRLQKAWKAATFVAYRQDSIFKLCRENIIAGFKIAFGVMPLVTSLGLIGLWLMEFTPLDDWLGYLFYPLFRAFGTTQPMFAGKAAAMGLPDMSIPIIMMKNSGTLLLKFVIAVVSISETLFFSASIPCIIASEIPLKIRHMVVIWFERVVIAILITVPIGLLMDLPDIM